MEASVEQKHWEHMWAFVENPWKFQRTCSPSETLTHLNFLCLNHSLRWDKNKIHFSPCPTGLVFCSLSYRRAWVITSCDDWIPQNGIKVMPNLAETRTKWNSPYKGGGMEIDLGVVGRDEWEYFKLPSSLLVNPTNLHSYWIGWAIVSEWTGG